MHKTVMQQAATGAKTALNAVAKPAASRPPSAYILFGKAERPKLPQDTPTALMKELGLRLKKLGDAGQAPFVAEALKLKAAPSTQVPDRKARARCWRVRAHPPDRQPRAQRCLGGAAASPESAHLAALQQRGRDPWGAAHARNGWQSCAHRARAAQAPYPPRVQGLRRPKTAEQTCLCAQRTAA